MFGREPSKRRRTGVSNRSLSGEGEEGHPYVVAQHAAHNSRGHVSRDRSCRFVYCTSIKSGWTDQDRPGLNLRRCTKPTKISAITGRVGALVFQQRTIDSLNRRCKKEVVFTRS
jgi:hypothetical protein